MSAVQHVIYKAIYSSQGFLPLALCTELQDEHNSELLHLVYLKLQSFKKKKRKKP